jgi:hypothetical protein
METPDFTGTAGTETGVAWHILSRQATVAEYGEGVTGSAQFLVYGAEPVIAPFDRCVFAGRVWEVRSVLQRGSFRTIRLVEVGGL